MSYTNLLYHIVYATKERAPLITNVLRPRLHEYLGGIVKGLGSVPIEINGVSDHVHLLVRFASYHRRVRLLKQAQIKFFWLGETTNAWPVCMAGPLWCFYDK